MALNKQKGGSAPACSGASEAYETYAPRKLMFAENAKLTIKLPVGAGSCALTAGAALITPAFGPWAQAALPIRAAR